MLDNWQALDPVSAPESWWLNLFAGTAQLYCCSTKSELWLVQTQK
jgi:hypothetical protein